MPGAGKTVMGKRLAEKLGWQFIDLDEWIVESAGLSIADIFSSSGEEFFRKIEQECLQKTANIENAVIASGGGTPCHHENMDWMNAHGLTVFLDIPVEVIASRLLYSGSYAKRPLLAGSAEPSALENRLGNLLISRAPFYLKAHLRISKPSDELVIKHVSG
jgi:shikimate kinase